MQKRARPLVLIVLALFTLLVGATLGSAQAPTGPNATSDDEGWQAEARHVTFEMGDRQGFTYESVRETERAHDRIRAAFDLLTARLSFSYDDLATDDAADDATDGATDDATDDATSGGQATDDGVAGPAEPSIAAELSFVALVEYRDVDGNGQFDLSDEVVQRVPLRDNYLAFVAGQNGNGPPYTPVVRYPFFAGGFLELHFTIPDRPTVLDDGREAPPTSLPFTMVLERFPVREAGTLVALETRLESSIEPDRQRGTPKGLLLPQDDVQAVYEWQPTAQLATPRTGAMGDATNDTAHAVQGAILTTERRVDGELTHLGIVIFTYPQDERAEHAASLSVAPTPPPINAVLEVIKGDWRVYVTGIVAGAILVGTAALIKVRSSSGPRGPSTFRNP